MQALLRRSREVGGSASCFFWCACAAPPVMPPHSFAAPCPHALAVPKGLAWLQCISHSQSPLLHGILAFVGASTCNTMASSRMLAPVKPPQKKLSKEEYEESLLRLYDRPVRQAKKRREKYDADVAAQTQVCFAVRKHQRIRAFGRAYGFDVALGIVGRIGVRDGADPPLSRGLDKTPDPASA